MTQLKNKAIVYQVFTRLFGNKNMTNKPWGTCKENGVGKFSDFTDKALAEIKNIGVTHIWYTGVPHHALVGDYTQYGIVSDHPAVVKGRAGSPYAVKDYYNVNPDLAIEPAQRLNEFIALIERSHQHGLKVIIDIVPNHVAREYQGLTNPKLIKDFGSNDDITLEYHRDNNFYYIPHTSFYLPEFDRFSLPLAGEKSPLLLTPFVEFPAKWTGNGSRLAQPTCDDWYETAKINYGVRPDGSKDFACLPTVYSQYSHEAHYLFWKHKDVPDSWLKFHDITMYWLALGVDGFRYDMAEMVPVELWSFLNSAIKNKNPDAFLMAEVYQPQLYRDYIQLGKMDYLYNKIDLYDTLKAIIRGTETTDALVNVQSDLADIEHQMLNFLENHDEQRIPSADFAGFAEKGKPAMVVATLLSSSPTMLYFGQEVGEPAADDAGFGLASRTTIFDYFGVPHHQRWMNNGKFDGGLLTQSEKQLRLFYQRLLNFAKNSKAVMGEYYDLQGYNRQINTNYTDKLFAFSRYSLTEKIITIVNFENKKSELNTLLIPAELINQWSLNDGHYLLSDVLEPTRKVQLLVKDGKGEIIILLDKLDCYVLQF
ncbi:alpha-amylase [Photobacterium carnosum]|uniref:alpha-amylase family protein n=1 Tax=Photobacterium carnosum TaxID=2023717 RepID=UPI001C902C34|nr:alpha-amylase family protein [Photobacterium carnosum]MBY3788055.1 alpha-amylase [Photobacterium carnosum]MCD9532976.1 alpha-amylase [Photobacterium carnosum]